MNMHLVDWSIVFALLIFLVFIALISQRYTKSVSDFMTTGRVAGRYVLSISAAMASMGAVSFIALWEVGFEAGFPPNFWCILRWPIAAIVAVTGFGIYRYRQTRVMTLAQFIAIRYSTRLRPFMGLMAFVSGVFTFGIFPAVAARFVIYFSGLGENIPTIWGNVSTYLVVLSGLMLIALFFTLTGGQIAIVLTDFFQGIFTTIFSVIFVIFLFCVIDWTKIAEALAQMPPGKSMINPMDSASQANFNVWFYVIAMVGVLYNILSFQGAAGYTCSAKSPHEAKMARIYGQWKGYTLALGNMLIPIVAFTLMYHSDYAGFATKINSVLAGIENPAIRTQQTVPVVLAYYLPIGLRGMLCATVVAAFISTQDSGLHSWGSILLQDIIMSFRKTPYSPKRHMLYLRLCILAVAVLLFFVSFFYHQTQTLLMFFALAQGLFATGAGAVILGGLYWKRGTTAGSWAAMITGGTICLTGFVLDQIWSAKYGKNFPVNGQYIYAIGMVVSSLVYVIVSLFQRQEYNLDKLLHRGRYAVEETQVKLQDESVSGIHPWLIKLGLTHEFGRFDKFIFLATIVWTFSWFAIFLLILIASIFVDFSDGAWMIYWQVFMWIYIVIGIVIAVWFTVGGLREVRQMLTKLKTTVRNYEDDGMVIGHHSRGEKYIAKDDNQQMEEDIDN
jgi:solute:Na+ symporter, SSS family